MLKIVAVILKKINMQEVLEKIQEVMIENSKDCIVKAICYVFVCKYEF